MTHAPQISDATAAASAGETEEWRPLPGWESSYEVSSYGNVRSIDRIVTGPRVSFSIKGKLRRPWRDSRGYAYVHLRELNRSNRRAINRLVCAAFHGNPPTPKHHAAHNDGNPRNDYWRNLRWATPKENAADKVAHGTAPCMDSHGLFSAEQRAAIKQSITDETVTELQKRLGLSFGTAARILQEARAERGLISHHERDRLAHAERVTSLHAEGRTVGEIATIVGRSKPAVYVLLDARGLIIKTRKSRQRNP